MLTQDEIIKLAEQAGYCAASETLPPFYSWLARFTALVAQHEREACADLVRQLRDSITWFSHDSGAMRSALEQAENHIRARDKKGGARC